jgi:hypothetical protein
MKLSRLLHARETLVRQAGLANLAFAYQTLERFAARIARARLTGKVNLQPADPDDDRYWATLTALTGSQAALEEHFTEEDLTDVADAIAYATGRGTFDLVFHLDDFGEIFLRPLRAALEQAGITIDAPQPDPVEEHSSNENS